MVTTLTLRSFFCIEDQIENWEEWTKIFGRIFMMFFMSRLQIVQARDSCDNVCVHERVHNSDYDPINHRNSSHET